MTKHGITCIYAFIGKKDGILHQHRSPPLTMLERDSNQNRK